ncbi:hypothetical protein [Vibrio sp. TBV020]|uniref:hypothetical protein n=1 Tax=Vibrio sp. TBV020 TaxID=3137398 RepID=UPI0038CD4E61
MFFSRLIKVLPTLALFTLSIPAANAYQVSIDEYQLESGPALFGYVDGQLAKNFTDDGIELETYWVSPTHQKVSNKIYFIHEQANVGSVKFCIKPISANEICSQPYAPTNKNSQRQSRSNEANVDVSFVNFSALNKFYVGVKPTSKVAVDVTKGNISFIYHEQLDELNRVRDNKIDYSVENSELIGRALDNTISKLKACTLVSFSFSSPVNLESCTDYVPVLDQSMDPDSTICLFADVNATGAKYCFDNKTLNKPLRVPAPFDQQVSSISIAPNYRATISTTTYIRDNSQIMTLGPNNTYNLNDNFNDRVFVVLIESEDTAMCIYEGVNFTNLHSCKALPNSPSVVRVPNTGVSAITLSPRAKVSTYVNINGTYKYTNYQATTLWSPKTYLDGLILMKSSTTVIGH